jgi:hypothetical protein
VVQHPRVVRPVAARLLRIRGTTRPRRILPGRRAGTGQEGTGQEPGAGTGQEPTAGQEPGRNHVQEPREHGRGREGRTGQEPAWAAWGTAGRQESGRSRAATARGARPHARTTPTQNWKTLASRICRHFNILWRLRGDNRQTDRQYTKPSFCHCLEATGHADFTRGPGLACCPSHPRHHRLARNPRPPCSRRRSSPCRRPRR